MVGLPLNGLLDRAVAASPRARALCLALEGRRVLISATGMPLQLLLTARAGSLRGEGLPDPSGATTADVTVRGSPLALLTPARRDSDAPLANTSLGFSRDEQPAPQFRQLTRLLLPDVPTLLERV